MTLIGEISGRTYIKDLYFDDVVGALLNFDGGSGASATSPIDWRPPEPVRIRDISIVTGLTDTTKLQLTRNGVPTGDILRYAIHLTTLAYRPVLNIPYRAGQVVAGIQLA